MRTTTVAVIAVTMLTLGAHAASAGMVTFNFSGLPIATSDDPTFHPNVSAKFHLTGNTIILPSGNTGDELILTMTYNGANKTLERREQVFSAVIWDLDGFSGILEGVSATMPAGSQLVDADPAFDPATDFEFGSNMAGHWAFATDIDAGTSHLGLVGSIGVGAIGDINGELDSFGPPDLIDGTKTDDLEHNAPNGAPFTLVPTDVDLNSDGLPSQGPYIQDSVEITLGVRDDTLSVSQITNVQPFFGTNSDTLAPEPGSLSLFAIGLVGFCAGGAVRRSRRRNEHGVQKTESQ